MKIEQNIRAIMPILLDKGFSRAEKEETIYKLIQQISRLSWEQGAESMYQDDRGNDSMSWITWWKNITEEKQQS